MATYNQVRDFISERVSPVLPEVQAIIWDGCHKIYLALDEEQAEQFQREGWTKFIRITNQIQEASFVVDTLTQWVQESCGLEFIESVRTVPGKRDEYRHIIGQFEWEALT